MNDDTGAQQVAAAVAIGLTVLPQLAADRVGHALAAEALDAAGRWACGEPVPAERLVTFLMDDREFGMITLAQAATDDGVVRAWTVLETVIAVAAWHAAHRRGELPASLVSEVDENTVEDLLYPQAVEAGVPARAVAALRQHLESEPSAPVPDVAAIGAMQAVIRAAS